MIKSESNQSISPPPSPLMTSSAPSTPLSDSGIVSNNYNNGQNVNNSSSGQGNQQPPPSNGSNKPGYQTCSHANHELWWNTSPELPVSEFYTRSYKCKRCYIKQQTESKKTRQSPIGNGNGNNHYHTGANVVGSHHVGNNHSPSSQNSSSGSNSYPHNHHLSSSSSSSNSNNNNSNNNSNSNNSNNNNHLYQNSPSQIDNAINQTFSQNSSILGLASLSTYSSYNNNKNLQSQQPNHSQFNDKKNLNSKFLQKKSKQEDAHDFGSGSDQDENYPINPNNYIDQVISSKQFSMYSKQGGNNSTTSTNTNQSTNSNSSNKPPSPSSVLNKQQQQSQNLDMDSPDEKKIETFHYMCSTYNHLVDRDTGSPGYIDSWMKGRLEQTEYFGTIRIQGNLGCNGGGNGANSKIGGFFTEIIVSGKTYRGLVFEDLKSSNQSNNYPQQKHQQQTNSYSPNQSLATTNKKIKGQGRDSPTSFLPVINNSSSSSFGTNENLEALLKLGKQAKTEAVEESKKRKKTYTETDSYDDHQPSYALKSNYYN
ncbi:hypothetical protein DICPUDRAFT_93865 [Dictyostelium purpureum]|uniref:Uncharacterized protein n=1 Tax=Dictyostelium purpureum TaxID=5786 RepID=F0ZCM0_DICPU|nr:uncharacterized protein DICPUDRAFT_93865 [Dictyostelium purpureum]EGC38319.1 hypothetical protein DICPUDRAFT_93865 [Dictyostelium purpureum]|eukprot:XP_003285180.1 hypothetical protein DICPUDRAFT_93865 [Dictyostelium purpureum]